MRYIVRERIFSIGNKFNIKDEDGDTRFIVEGKVLTLRKKLKMYDQFKNLRLEIKEKLFRLLSEYVIVEDRKKIAKIKRKISPISPKYTINSIYGKYRVNGDILRYDFTISKGSKIVARISKKFIRMSDTYVVDIVESEDQAFILALVIVLDQIHHDYVAKNNNVTN